MSSNILSSLRQYHEAVKADLGAHFGTTVATIEAYDLDQSAPQDQARRAIKTPAILLGLEQIDSDAADDDGTERTPLRLLCTADCILSDRTDDLSLELREFARSVLSRVRHNRWSLAGAVRVPEALSAQPAELAPGPQGYGAWRALWEQVVYIGADVWAGTGQPPAEVYLGIAPRIGAAHVDDYFLIDSAPETGPIT